MQRKTPQPPPGDPQRGQAQERPAEQAKKQIEKKPQKPSRTAD